MADPNVKRVSVTAESAESFSPKSFDEAEQEGGKRITKPKSRKRQKRFEVGSNVTIIKVGGGTSPATLDQLVSSHVPGSNDTKAVGVVSDYSMKGAPACGGATATATATASQPLAKVILSKTKKKSKVILTAPKAISKTAPATTKKHKPAKRINMNLQGLTRKLSKAKHIHKKAKEDTIEEIKKALVKSNLINADSKAPERMLRQLYADHMVLKKKAL